MSNFKYPQYLTPNGFTRLERKPYNIRRLSANITAKTESSVSAVLGGLTVEKTDKPSRIRLLAEKRVLAKRLQERRDKGLSDDAAKILAEAIKTMLHS